MWAVPSPGREGSGVVRDYGWHCGEGQGGLGGLGSSETLLSALVHRDVKCLCSGARHALSPHPHIEQVHLKKTFEANSGGWAVVKNYI